MEGVFSENELVLQNQIHLKNAGQGAGRPELTEGSPDTHGITARDTERWIKSAAHDIPSPDCAPGPWEPVLSGSPGVLLSLMATTRELGKESQFQGICSHLNKDFDSVLKEFKIPAKWLRYGLLKEA